MTQNFNRQSERSRRRELRENATEAERQLWRRLRGKQVGAKFRRQYSVDSYIVDFYSPQVKVAVEVDGDSHFTPAAIAFDSRRTAYLSRFGIEVLRFTNVEVLQNLDGVLEVIAEVVKKRGLPPPDPLLRKEGERNSS